jgi:hypothetical protein
MSLSPEIQKQLDALPFYRSVPKDFNENLKFRRDLVKFGSKSKENAKEVWKACSRDILFYVNTMAWLYEPRKMPAALPFITYPYQDAGFLEINNAINNHDLLIEKSRDMGASWLCLTALQWRWQFRDMQSFLMVSRGQDSVDRSDDPDALFWKVDWLIKNQPKWMLPFFDADNDRKINMLVNRDNGSTMSGVATTGQAGMGGRKTAAFLDEFGAVPEGDAILSSTADVTPCRLINSTPQGTANAFYKLTLTPIKKLRFHWTEHPEKAKDSYYDPETKKIRSPWYDAECARRSPMHVAQNLDINYQGSAFQFFEGAVLDRILKEVVCDPVLIGELDFDPDTLEVRSFRETPNGQVRLWVPLDEKYRLPVANYAAGADISMGTGASNSAFSAGNKQTKEKVLEFVANRLDPKEFATYCVALCRWMKNDAGTAAHLAWEANGGCGKNFGDKVIQLGHRNIYWKTNENSVDKKASATPGWWANTQTKNALLLEYQSSLKTSSFTNRSYYAVDECRNYIQLPNGAVEHSSAGSTDDPSGAKDNHGDRVIADALCWHLMKSVAAEPEKPPEVPANCIFARREARRRQAAEQELY